MSNPLGDNTLVRKFQRIYAGLTVANLADLNDIYSQDIHFVDPFHSVRGREEFMRYMKSTYDGVATCTFTYEDVIEAEGRALVAWKMRMRHRIFRPQEEVVLRGASRLHFTNVITFQEDYYDGGAMIYERLPLVGGLVRAIKRRLAK